MTASICGPEISSANSADFITTKLKPLKPTNTPRPFILI